MNPVRRGVVSLAEHSAQASYRIVAADIRSKIASGEFPAGIRMPTEADLRELYGVSRHTVRAALKQIVADGLVDQVQGSGTYVRRHPLSDGGYTRSIGSMDDLTMWPGTQIEVIEPFRTRVDPSIAARMKLPYVEVDTAILRRMFDNRPFAVTRHHVRPELGEKFRNHGLGNLGAGTVIGATEPFLEHPIAGVQQQINAIAAPGDICGQIGVDENQPILLVERLYYDTQGKFIEFTESHFNPRLYAFRLDLRRKGRGG